MKTAQSIIYEIKTEDELPTDAGARLRSILNNELGYREIKIIADWLNDYLELSPNEKSKLLNFCIK